jgi:uncharacterized protein (TIGR02217 family)
MSHKARGGVTFNTVVVGSTSGREVRNSVWQYGRAQFDLQGAMRTTTGVANPYSVQIIRNFFRVCKGQAYGFRFRDWTDYQDEGGGVLGPLLTNYSTPVTPTGAGNGTPNLQMYKVYQLSPLYDVKPVQKPLTTQLYRNGVLMSIGTGTGQYSIDTTTGIITLTPDQTVYITGWTVGNPTQFSVSSVPSGWGVGTVIYISGAINDGGLLNGKAFTISAISGTTITIPVDTTGQVTLNSGYANAYPGASATFTWTGTFDLPVRFAQDSFSPQIEQDGTLYGFSALQIAEIRL